MLLHLERTFDMAADQRPDLMEPYLIRLAGANEDEQIAIMREGLAATFKQRNPIKRGRR